MRQLKYRKEHNEFIAEGERLVIDLVNSHIKVKTIIASASWFRQHQHAINDEAALIETGNKELTQVSNLATPQQVIAIVDIPQSELNISELSGKLSLALYDINNPGNLGTIIRTADWFGIENIICSSKTVDAFNPKVVQGSMGSISRVNIHYVDLYHFLSETELPVELFATSIDGEDIRQTQIPNGAILIMGNEAHGIDKKILFLAKKKIFVPSFTLSNRNMGPESLNVAIATSICCYEIRRNLKK